MSEHNDPIDFGESSTDWFSGNEQLGHWSADDVYSPWSQQREDGIVGTPEEDVDDWSFQQTAFTCAVVCQKMILHGFGIDVSEAQLVYEATSNGWLTAGGTSPSDVGQLLELHGVACHTHQGADVEALIAELAHGHKVVVGVDSGEYSGQDWFFEDLINPNGADHAVVVTGLDMHDPNHPMVYLNDPGHPDGAGVAYPLDRFLDAWADSGNMYVATDAAPFDLASDPLFGSHYDPGTGLYMDVAYWASFAATVLHLTSTIAEHFAHHDSHWDNDDHASHSDPLDAWEQLDDSSRNSLFYSI